MFKAVSGILTIFLIFTGCYTVIKHPEMSQEQNDHYKRQIYFSDDCASCHAGNLNTFTVSPHRNLPRLDYIYQNNRWAHYYESAWWYRDIFTSYSASGGSSDNSPLPTTSARPRYPGANRSGGLNSNTRITGGGTTSGGSNTRITGGSGSSDTSSGQGTVNNQQDDDDARKAVRGSGKSDAGSKRSKKAQRREKK